MEGMRTRAGGLVACGVFFLCMLGAVSAHARPAQVEDYPLYSPLTGSGYGTISQVVLTREVLSRTYQSLDDIRIFDDLGRETPFFVHVSGTPAPSLVKWDIQGSQAFGEDQVFLLGRTPDMGAVKDLALVSSQAWACSDVEVFSSVDGQAWLLLTAGKAANLKPVLNLRWMDMPLPETHAPFLKVVFRKKRPEGGLSPFGCFSSRPARPELSDPANFADVRGFVSHVSRGDANGTEYDEMVVSRFGWNLDSQGNTVIELPGVSLPVTEVRFEVGQSCFYRDVAILAGGEEKGSSWALKGSGGICRIPGLGLSRLSLKADLGSAHRIMIRVVNGGEQPLALSRITFRWPRTHLLFMPEAGRKYRLFYGESGASPRTSSLDAAPGDGPFAQWKAGAPLVNDIYRPRTEGPRDVRRFMIIAMVILVLYCIGFWAIQVRGIMGRR
jgi:hypothetical protein